MSEFVVMASGYFDPIHVGHIEYLKLAKEIANKHNGKLVVILNNDQQCILKKGKPFMIAREKKIILEALECVDEVFDSIDNEKFIGEDGVKHVPIINSIRAIVEKNSGCKIIFAKGGDRFDGEVPETAVCRELGIDIVDGLGNKIQASSDLIAEAEK